MRGADGSVTPNPDVRIVATLSATINRGLCGLGLLPVQLDAVPTAPAAVSTPTPVRAAGSDGFVAAAGRRRVAAGSRRQGVTVELRPRACRPAAALRPAAADRLLRLRRWQWPSLPGPHRVDHEPQVRREFFAGRAKFQPAALVRRRHALHDGRRPRAPSASAGLLRRKRVRGARRAALLDRSISNGPECRAMSTASACGSGAPIVPSAASGRGWAVTTGGSPCRNAPPTRPRGAAPLAAASTATTTTAARVTFRRLP